METQENHYDNRSELRSYRTYEEWKLYIIIIYIIII